MSRIYLPCGHRILINEKQVNICNACGLNFNVVNNGKSITIEIDSSFKMDYDPFDDLLEIYKFKSKFEIVKEMYFAYGDDDNPIFYIAVDKDYSKIVGFHEKLDSDLEKIRSVVGYDVKIET